MSKRRQQQYVDQEVQSSLMTRICGHWALFLVANVLAIFGWTLFLDTPAESLEATISLTWQRIVPFGIVSLVLFPVFLWDAIKLSNRFAGPIVRVRRTLANYADGKEFENIEFRQGDFWKTFANDLNRAFLRRNRSDEVSSVEPS